ncbi:MAG: alkaline shock response membrane anchor protein AmaP [Chloroflexota bacterium]
MGILDRIVLELMVIGLAILAAMAILMAIGWWMPLDQLQMALSAANGRWLVGLIGLVYLIGSARFIWYGFARRRYPSQTLTQDTELGEVRVSLGAVESLVKKVAHQVRGVRDIRAWVGKNSAGGIDVEITVVVSPESNIPSLSDQIQTSIRDYVHNVVGVTVGQVKVLVENISNESRRGRVG